MLDYVKLKSHLSTKISKVTKQKTDKNNLVNNCDHNYKKYKQTIRQDNDEFTKQAYFVVLLCDKCKDKKIIDYKVI